VTFVAAAFLVLSFLQFDLLTTIACISAWNAVSNLVILRVDTSFSNSTVLLTSLMIVGLVLAEFYFAFNGRRFSDVEVRPLYAEHVAERQALQAEVSAAREAQLRLAPQELPSLEGIEVAAACRHAGTVGGDFYDFFEMGPSKLGIFLAEGGDGGLSAALSIAFAKGLLLPMAARDASAGEMMTALRSQLSLLRSDNPSMGVLLAVLNVETGRLDYERLGDYPQLFLHSSQASMQLGSPEFAESPRGSLQLEAADRLVLFTDGMSATIEAAQKLSAKEWLAGFFQTTPVAGAASWHVDFEKALSPHIRKARRRGVDDDISTILLHFERPISRPKEEVA